MATGVKACWRGVLSDHVVNDWGETGLQHLNIRNTEIKISRVAEDEAPGKEESNRENRLDEHLLGHTNAFDAIEEICCPVEDTSSDGRESEMKCYKEDGVFEAEGVVEVVVVDNDT
jgi:hypothetical protein